MCAGVVRKTPFQMSSASRTQREQGRGRPREGSRRLKGRLKGKRKAMGGLELDQVHRAGNRAAGGREPR